MKMKNAVMALTFGAMLTFVGCAHQPQNRHVSSEERTYASDDASREKKPAACKEYEVRNEVDGSCEIPQRNDRPFRRNGF